MALRQIAGEIGICWLGLRLPTFFLDKKSRQKSQGKHDGSARFMRIHIILRGAYECKHLPSLAPFSIGALFFLFGHWWWVGRMGKTLLSFMRISDMCLVVNCKHTTRSTKPFCNKNCERHLYCQNCNENCELQHTGYQQMWLKIFWGSVVYLCVVGNLKDFTFWKENSL